MPRRASKTPDKSKPPKKGQRALTGTSRLTAAAIKRRDALSALLEADGPAGLDVYGFAETWGVHWSTVYNDLKALGKGVGPERAEQLEAAIMARLAKAEHVFIEVADEGDGKERVAAAKALLEMCRVELELLDLLGLRKGKLPGSPERPLVVQMWQPTREAPPS